MFGLPRIEPEQLCQLEIFQNLSDKALTDFARVGTHQKVLPGTILTQEGHMPTALHVPTFGIIELFSTHSGKETTLMLIHRGSSYSLGALLSRTAYLESSRSLQICHVMSFPINTVYGLLETDMSFSQALSNELVRSNHRYLQELKNQKLRTSLERLAAWILKTDILNGKTGHFRIGFGKKTLASHLGMTPENLSRTFAYLKENAIQMSGREISIIRRPALEQIAKLNRMID